MTERTKQIWGKIGNGLFKAFVNVFFFFLVWWGVMLLAIVKASEAFELQFWIIAVLICVFGTMTSIKYWYDSF